MHEVNVDVNRSIDVDLHAETAETKSHSDSKSLGTPTLGRCSSRHSFRFRIMLHNTSNGIPSDSVVGRQSAFDICRAILANACAAR